MKKVTMDPVRAVAPLPAILVTCGTGEEKNIISISWSGMINRVPPMTYISVMKTRHSYGIIMKEREYVMNLCNEKMLQLFDWCGCNSGRNYDKWKMTGFTEIPASIVKCPMIEEAPVNIECKVVDVIEYPTHDMFVAEIVKVHADENLMREKGKINFANADLLAFAQNRYMVVKNGELGRQGFAKNMFKEQLQTPETDK